MKFKSGNCNIFLPRHATCSSKTLSSPAQDLEHTSITWHTPHHPDSHLVADPLNDRGQHTSHTTPIRWGVGESGFRKLAKIRGRGGHNGLGCRWREHVPGSEVSKRGWRTQGVGARKSLPHHKFRPFSAPLFLCPLMSRRTQFWGTFLAVFWALLVANPLPPTPFRNLWQGGQGGRP